MTLGSMSAAVMRELVEAGEAKPLLEGFETSPTSYGGAWWYVPSDADDDADYLPADSGMSAELDRLRARSERIDALRPSSGEA